MPTLKYASHSTVRRASGAHFNLSGVFDTQNEVGLEADTVVDFSFLDPPTGKGELGFIQHYRVLRVIGAGGMGLVLEAEDTHLKRAVALKVMKREFVASYSSRERFLLEARAAAALESDHIVTVFQVGMAKDVPFLAMQLLHGEPLDARLDRESPLPMPEAMLIGKQVAEGLLAAHEKGLVHRDIKPANIWLEADERTKAFRRVKLLDFGLARMLETNQKLTNAGMIVGTPQYMSPEQASGTPVDCRSDLFSLGTVLYVMLTGRLPFDAPTAPAMLLEIVTKDATPPSKYNSLIPREVDALIMKLMAKSPDDRPSSAQDVVDALDAILVEYSFLIVPARASGVVGFPTRDIGPGSSGTRLNQTVQTRAACPTMQVNSLPVFVPMSSGTPPPYVPPATPKPAPSVDNPFADLAIDLSALPNSPYESSKSRARLPQVSVDTGAETRAYKWIAIVSLSALAFLLLYAFV